MRRRAKLVKAAFYKKPMQSFPGYGSCSPHFDIRKVGHREWQIVHVPSGFGKQICRSLLEARMMCGALAGLGFDWAHPEKWAKWQSDNSWLMLWFRATHQVMYQI